MSSTTEYLGIITTIIGILMIFGFGSPQRDKRTSTGYKNNQIPRFSFWKRLLYGSIITFIGLLTWSISSSNNVDTEPIENVDNIESEQ